MRKTADRLKPIGEYVFSRLARKKSEVEKLTGRKVLDLSIGSPDFPPSQKYIRKLSEFFGEKTSHLYPGYGAIPELKKSLIDWYRKRFNVDIGTMGLLPLLGAKEGVAYMPMALLDPGDEVLVPDPGYPAFSEPAKMAGARIVTYDATADIDIKKLRNKVTAKTVFIWVNMPANPTGIVAETKQLETLVDFARKNNVWIVYDNAYSEITFDGYKAPSILQLGKAADIAVEIGSFSKSHSFAGYRMGWIVGNNTIIDALSKIKSQMDSGMSVPLQKLGAFALNSPDEKWHESMIESYNSRREIICSCLEKIGLNPVKPKAGLYLWVKIPEGFTNSEEFVLDLLERKQILLAPGTAFGKNGRAYVRVSICSNIDNINNYFV